MYQNHLTHFDACPDIDARAALIAERQVMPELRAIWPHAFAETVSAVASALKANSPTAAQRGAPPLT